jgi:hypothetical protein
MFTLLFCFLCCLYNGGHSFANLRQPYKYRRWWCILYIPFGARNRHSSQIGMTQNPISSFIKYKSTHSNSVRQRTPPSVYSCACRPCCHCLSYEHVAFLYSLNIHA